MGRVAGPRGQVPAPRVHARDNAAEHSIQLVRQQSDFVGGCPVVGHTVIGGQVAFPIEERRPVRTLCNQRVEERTVQFAAQGRRTPIVLVVFVESAFKDGFGGNRNGSVACVQLDPLNAAVQEAPACFNL